MTPVPRVNKKHDSLVQHLIDDFLDHGGFGVETHLLSILESGSAERRQSPRWRQVGLGGGPGASRLGQGGHKDASSGSREGRHLHDFGLGAVGSRRRHLDILDVLEVNSLQGLQALAAQFGGHGRSCGENRPG